MFVKNYIAKEMPEAIERIRKELGPDAVILSSRQIRSKGLAGLFGRKLVEVTVAYEPNPAKSIIPERMAQKPQEQAAKPEPKEEPIEDNSKLYNQLASVKEAMHTFKPNSEPAPSNEQLPQALLELENTLTEREVNPAHAKKLLAQIKDITERFTDDPKKVAENLIIDLLKEPAQVKLKKYRMNILMLLGPTGVGKTTTIVKLAGLYTLEQGLKVGFINADTYRVAAKEQLNTYAEIMGLPIRTIYTPDEMEEALLSMQDRDVVLIDTAGKNPADKKYRKEVQDYLKLGIDEVFLAVSAAMSFGACRQLIEQYSFLKEYKLIITKLDEVEAWGNVLNISSLSQKPIAFVTNGQNVPYDISTPNPKAIAKNLLEFERQ